MGEIRNALLNKKPEDALARRAAGLDRLITLGRFARRPVSSLAEPEPLPAHVQGAQIIRGGAKKKPVE